MGWTSGLLTGVAEHLAAQGVGTWRADGTAYAPGETAIVLGSMPPTPDRVICLNLYRVASEGAWDVTEGLQVRTRATPDPRAVWDLADEIRDALDGLANVSLGGVWVSQMFHRSGDDLGSLARQDRQADRYERTDNYYVQATRPSDYRDQ